jgi:hypothetical protein
MFCPYLRDRNSFFLSLNFWGIASLSVVYAKGYAGLLVLRLVLLIFRIVVVFMYFAVF